MDLNKVIEFIIYHCKRNFATFPEEFIVVEDNGYITLSVKDNHPPVLLGKINVDFLKKTEADKNQAGNLLLWITDCAKVYGQKEKWNKEFAPTFDENFETVEKWEAKEFGPLSKVGEPGFKLLRVTEGYDTIVIAGGGIIYIHHKWLYDEGKRPFFFETNDDTLENRYLQSKHSRHDKEKDLECPDMTFTMLSKAQSWVTKMRKANKE